jgi:antitoxin component YwqK of YwqJK toxin-antitoxin module
MKRLSVTLALCVCLSIATQAQNVTRYYLNNNSITQSKDSATYYLKFETTSEGSVRYSRYCMNNKLKETGTVQNTTTLIKEGEVITYYSNGNKKEVSNYTAGLINGMQTRYFENGNINYKIIINASGYGDALTKESAVKYIYCANSEYKTTLQDGNGYFTAYDENLSLTQEGNVKNTHADGLWKGFDRQQLAFAEVYKNGKLIKGENFATDGKTYAYNQRNQRPEPKGGIDNFYKYIATSMETIDASNANMLIKFMVDDSGKLKNIEVINSSDNKINAMAVNVLKNAPKWNPALAQGKPVQAAYYMPISIQR